MTFVSQGMSGRYLAGNSVATGSWSAIKSPRWVRTLSHLGAAICITASTSALARSFTTRGSRTVCAEDRWNIVKLISTDVGLKFTLSAEGVHIALKK
jgi:hypothetical protein